MGATVIDRAFFELVSNAPDVEKGFSGLIRTMAGTNEAVKQAQDRFLSLNNAEKDLTAQMDRLDQKHEELVARMRSGTLSTNELNEARKQEKSLLGEIERTEAKVTASKGKIEAAQKAVTKATDQSGSSFDAFGKVLGDFAAHPVATTQRGIESLVTAMGPTAVGIAGITAAAGAAAFALFEMGKNAAEGAQQITNMSLATGLTVEQVQVLKRLGEERGLTDLVSQIERVQTQLGKGAGGPFTEALLKMGIAPKEGADALYYLKQMQEHYALITDEQKRNAQAHADLGIRMKGLIPLVVDSTGAIWAQYEAIKASAAIQSGDFIKSATETNKQLQENGRAWVALGNQIDRVSEKYVTSPIANFGALLAKGWANFLQNPLAPFQSATGGAATPDMMSAHGAGAGSIGPPTPTATGVPAGNILEQRMAAIAAADAIAAGIRKDLIADREKLNQLEREYAAIKANEKGMEFDEARLQILAAQIARQKEIIKEIGAADAAEQKWHEGQAAGWARHFEQERKDLQDFADDLLKIHDKAVEDFAKGMERLGELMPRGIPGTKEEESSTLEKALGWPKGTIGPDIALPKAGSVRGAADQGMRQVSTVLTDFVKGLVDGRSALDQLKNAVTSLARFFIEKFVNNLFSGNAGAGLGNGVGSFFGGLWGGLKNLFSGGTSAATSAGGIATLGAGGLAGEASAASMFAGGVVPSAITTSGGVASGLGKPFGGGTGSLGKFGQTTGGKAAAAGLMMGGTMMMSDAFRRGGAVGAIEGMAGGAAAGFSVGGPIGAAIGAGVGFVLGIMGGGAAWLERERKRRADIQSSYMSAAPGSVAYSSAFGAGGDVMVESDLRGKSMARSVVVNLSFVSPTDLKTHEDEIANVMGRAMLRGGNSMGDALSAVG